MRPPTPPIPSSSPESGAGAGPRDEGAGAQGPREQRPAEEEEAAVEAEAPTMADPGASTDVQIGLDASIAIVHTETGADGATQTADGGSGAATRSRKTGKKRGARDVLPESAVAASAHDGQTNPQAAAADVPGDEDAPTRRASLRQRRK